MDFNKLLEGCFTLLFYVIVVLLGLCTFPFIVLCIMAAALSDPTAEERGIDDADTTAVEEFVDEIDSVCTDSVSTDTTQPVYDWPQ